MRYLSVLTICCMLLWALSCSEPSADDATDNLLTAGPETIDATQSVVASASQTTDTEDSDATSVTQADAQEWMQWVPEATPDVGLGDRPLAYQWPDAPDFSSAKDTSLVPDEGNTACIFRAAARIAKVSVEAIVRDDGNVAYCGSQWTVFRLRVLDVVQGGPLPEVVYGATATGRFVCKGMSVSTYRYQTALRKVGDIGYANIYPFGYDPIRFEALVTTLKGDNADPSVLVIPARVVGFGMFLTLDPDTGRYTTRENPDLAKVAGDSMSEGDILSAVAAKDSATGCVQHASVCGDCDTSEDCYGEGSETPCGCINDWKGCRELPAEDPAASRLYQVK